MAALVECFVTHGALVWPISRVCSLVNLKCACLTETFTTYITSVGLFTCVCSHMSCQYTALSKSSSTNSTLVWLFSSVCSHVDFHVALETNLQAALFTLRSFIFRVMLIHVLSIQMQIIELVATFRARVRLLSIMGPHVSIEIKLSFKSLITSIALKLTVFFNHILDLFRAVFLAFITIFH